MSGFGERFRRAGYDIPKPLVEIDNKPIIAHVIDMFPGETNFIFVCSNQHLKEKKYQMRETIERHCPTGKIIGIDPHKRGPIFAVQQVEHLLDPNSPVVVNYCDFSCYWDWEHFKKYVELNQCAGALPAYKGFHPHSLGTTNYAYIRENLGWASDIQEKQPFTDNRMDEYASSGTYYFSSAKTMSDAFKFVVDNDLILAGEYYVSLAYKALFAQNKPVAVYPLQHFMQWGTPEDVTEYQYWSRLFSSLNNDQKPSYANFGSLLIPMAGLGQRFADEGYQTPKPLIKVSGCPMVLQATADLPPANNHVYVLRKDMIGYEEIAQNLKDKYPEALLHTVDGLTDGQACSAALGIGDLMSTSNKNIDPVTIAACDNGALYNPSKFEELINDDTIDIIVWGVRGYPNAVKKPEMYGWIKTDGIEIKKISVKEPLEAPHLDPIVIGTFTFRRAKDFQLSLDSLIKRNGKINGEYYIDSLVNDAIDLGMRVCYFEIDHYLCWGTPNDLRTFEYWQSCFHKWDSHPYDIAKDKHIPLGQRRLITEKYAPVLPISPSSECK